MCDALVPSKFMMAFYKPRFSVNHHHHHHIDQIMMIVMIVIIIMMMMMNDDDDDDLYWRYLIYFLMDWSETKRALSVKWK